MASGSFRLLWTFAFVAAVTAVFMVLALAQLEATPRLPERTAFSAEKAVAMLERLLKEGRPHVAGTPENAVVRDRIVEELKAAGYTPEIQSAYQCSPPEFGPGCSAVENIIAVHKGTGGGKAVLATAHYDSVPAGPGAADDGAGTAVMIELARHMATRTTRNDIIFLITDAEETGLRGAIAFAKHHPLMKQVGVVVNVEARGASGPSMMFETGEGSAKLMELFARSVSRPTANSLTYEIYKLLPNDTDFSVYRKLGLSGFNFAFSNSASLYHSARDNTGSLDWHSTQHQGDNAFEVTEALADADLATLKSTSDASYFDLHGRMLFVWPSAINLPIAVLSLLAFAGLIFMHRSAFSLSRVVWAVAALIAAPILLFAMGYALSFPLGIWPDVHPLDHPFPWPGRTALAAAGVLVALLLGAVVARRSDARAAFLVNWLVISALAVFVAATITGASYPFVWPAAGAAIAAWAETLARKRLTIAALIGFVMAAFFWLTYLLVLELVLGFDLSQYKILVLIPLVLALTPVFAAAFVNGGGTARPIVAATTAVVIAASALVASQTPAYSWSHPRGQNVVYYDDGSGKPRWLIGFVGAPDEAYLKANGFPAHDEDYKLYGMIPSSGRFKPATDLRLPQPVLTANRIETNAGLTVMRGAIHRARNGQVVYVAIAPGSGIRSVRVADQDVLDSERLNGKAPAVARLWGLTDQTPIEITFDPKQPAEVTLLERSQLPQSEEAAKLVQTRADDAAPVHSGDTAIVLTKIDLKKMTPQATSSP